MKACIKAKVTKTDFHGLRRSCGARWLEVGIPLFYVSRMLGHADISSTAKHYAGLADSSPAAEIDKVNVAMDAVASGDGKAVRMPVRTQVSGDHTEAADVSATEHENDDRLHAKNATAPHKSSS